MGSVIRFVTDRLANIVTGMGTPKARSFATEYAFVEPSIPELDAAYRGSWLARKVVDIPAFDACREWRDWQAEGDAIEKIEAEEKRLDVRGKVLSAKIKARLHGGSAILIGDGGANPAEELKPETIGLGGLRYLTVLAISKLSAGDEDTDVASPWYGQPAWYELQSSNGAAPLRIHPSRLVRFVGAPIADTTYVRTALGWGDSVLAAVMDAIKQAETVSTNIADLTHEAKSDVLGVPDLMLMASDADYEARFLRRVSIAAAGKSMHNLLIRDAAETWDQKTVSFATLPDVIDRFYTLASGAADIPATRFLGQSPAGLSATGESDLRNYYDRVSAEQELYMTPALTLLDECLIRSATGARDKDTYYEWAPLWQMSETDAAEVAYKKAQAFKVDAESGFIPDQALSKGRVNQLIEDGVYPGLEAAMAEAPDVDFDEIEEQPEANEVAAEPV